MTQKSHEGAESVLFLLYLKVTLVRVENDRLLSVELPLHLQRQSADRRLEVRLLSIHHQPHSVLHGVLWIHRQYLQLTQLSGGSNDKCVLTVHVFLTLAKMSTLWSILFICFSSSSVNLFSRGSSWPVCTNNTQKYWILWYFLLNQS